VEIAAILEREQAFGRFTHLLVTKHPGTQKLLMEVRMMR
jgi:hypothetical protein